MAADNYSSDVQRHLNRARVGYRRLDLSGFALKTLPSAVTEFDHLESLYLQNTSITALPESIGQLPRLEELVLADNPLTSLPDSIGQLSQLEWLAQQYLTSEIARDDWTTSPTQRVRYRINTA